MENDDRQTIKETTNCNSNLIKNGVVSPHRMANNCSTEQGTVETINGGEDGDYSSESDALVIDEKKLQQFENNQQHFNPYFNESLYELSQQHHYKKHNKKVGLKPTKLREYAQYLGLQPSVQFKCSKCGRAGFESLITLNEHIIQCTTNVQSGENLIQNQNNTNCGNGDESNNKNSVNTSADDTYSSFKLTRKVFLCSPCGTYYENWNLYLHMLEVHKRYVCLYCLGMFSILNDLCLHIEFKHKLVPNYRQNLQDFFNFYKEPCYLICCDCNKLFNEQDNFFYHNCNNNNKKKINSNKLNNLNVKQIRPENHVTGDSSINSSGDNLISLNHSNNYNISDNSNNTTIINSNKRVYESSDSEPDFKGFDLNENDNNSVNLTKMEIVEEEEILSQATALSSLSDTRIVTTPPPIETRKVPKLSLKLKPGSFPKIEQQQTLTDDDDDDNNEEDEEIDEQEEEDEIEDGNEENEDNDENDEIEEEEEEFNDKTRENLEENTDKENNEQTNERQEPSVDEENNKNNKTIEENFNQTENLNTTNGSDGGGGNEIQIAGPDISIIELDLDKPLDKFNLPKLIQKMLLATCLNCIYCNHARIIAVNGKQLGLHAISEHRYSAIVSSITAEELIPENFVQRIKDGLNNLDNLYFNLEEDLPEDLEDEGQSQGRQNIQPIIQYNLFECFQCYFKTTIHKELYLHNRKLHAKNLLLCIMCKSNFYSYSELICHLCPGLYILDYDLKFRCCLCLEQKQEQQVIPSAFRLMVHLRKYHNICDVCFELCNNQYKLSNHIWKHKLYHFCYRCGISYRNKPDITRHLYWKHGTESVLCKKCLQKKWPHVYHFCIPPLNFLCDECTFIFNSANSLKVHKRLHTNFKPHQCLKCEEKFISKKLLIKHNAREHEKKIIENNSENNQTINNSNLNVVGIETTTAGVNDEKMTEVVPVPSNNDDTTTINQNISDNSNVIDEINNKKTKIDVYDLPELNLSESDSSDESDNENDFKKIDLTSNIVDDNLTETITTTAPTTIVMTTTTITTSTTHSTNILDNNNKLFIKNDDDEDKTIIENIWDDFKNYQANKEKFDNLLSNTTTTNDYNNKNEEVNIDLLTVELALRDHDYIMKPSDVSFIEMTPDLNQSVDHDYCSPKGTTVSSPNHLNETDKKQSILLSVDNNNTTTSAALTTNNIETSNCATNKKNSSSDDDSSDSDSSCSCGSNCSCTSTSGGNTTTTTADSSDSDSSTEEGRRRQQLRRDKRSSKRNMKKMNEKPLVVLTTTALTNEAASTASTNLIMVDNDNKLIDLPICESDLETTESETDEEFYDKKPHKIAKKILEEKRNQLIADISTTTTRTTMNGCGIVDVGSRSNTPSNLLVVDDDVDSNKKIKLKKSKSKKKKKKKKSNRDYNNLNNIHNNSNIPMTTTTTTAVIPTTITTNYYQYYQQQPAIAPITLSRVPTLLPTTTQPQQNTSRVINQIYLTNDNKLNYENQDNDNNLRASKRRRVPNKFYGYSSDEEQDKTVQPITKWRRLEPPPVQQQQFVPPITIKNINQPRLPPISIRTNSITTMNQTTLSNNKRQNNNIPPLRIKTTTLSSGGGFQPTTFHNRQNNVSNNNINVVDTDNDDDDSDSSSSDDDKMIISTTNYGTSTTTTLRNNLLPNNVNPDALYCYCKCPYDEVSEMIGCDSKDCAIEWFHFECVGIMVPPKGHWYCPECRKKRQQRHELLKNMAAKNNL